MHGCRDGNRRERNGFMFMDRLPLVVVFRMKLAISASESLRCLVGLEAQILLLLMLRLICLAQTLIAQHKVVMGLQVLGIDVQDLLEFSNGIAAFPLKEEHPA